MPLPARALLAGLRYTIAGVWLISGLFGKVLHLVPRHEQIVARILGPAHAGLLTQAIGGGEILIGFWVLSRWQPRLCAATQLLLVAIMNAPEFWLASDLLLWGHLNAFFAGLFMLVVYYQAFVLESKAVAFSAQKLAG